MRVKSKIWGEFRTFWPPWKIGKGWWRCLYEWFVPHIGSKHRYTFYRQRSAVWSHVGRLTKKDEPSVKHIASGNSECINEFQTLTWTIWNRVRLNAFLIASQQSFNQPFYLLYCKPSLHKLMQLTKTGNKIYFAGVALHMHVVDYV